jgi:hypothetical protein
MKVTTTTGWVLDTHGGWAKDATEYAHSKGLKDLIVVLGESPQEEKEYIILRQNDKENKVIYSNQSYESICIHIDVLKLTG